jgi:hypothetical protein
VHDDFCPIEAAEHAFVDAKDVDHRDAGAAAIELHQSHPSTPWIQGGARGISPARFDELQLALQGRDLSRRRACLRQRPEPAGSCGVLNGQRFKWGDLGRSWRRFDVDRE